MESQKQREDFYILPEIPFKDEDIISNISNIKAANAVKLDIEKCHFPLYHNMFTYLSNCGVKIGSINIRELENEKICELVKEYVKYDRILTFLNLNEIVASVIYTGKREFIQNNKFAEVVQMLKEDKQFVSQINQVLYGLNKICLATITEDKQLTEMINKSDIVPNPDIVGKNIVSLVFADTFAETLNTIDDMDIEFKNYKMYGENINPSRTMVSGFIDTFLPYKMIYIYNQLILHPEKKEALQKELNKIKKGDK